MNINKKILFSLGIVLVVIFALLSRNKNKQQSITPPPSSKDTEVLKDNKSPSQINWQLTDNSLPEKGKVYRIDSNVSDEYFLNISNKLGFANEPTIKNQKLIVINEGTNKSIHFDKVGNKIAFSLNLYNNQLGSMTNKFDTDKLRFLFFEVLKNTFNIAPDQIKISKIDYQENVGPRYVSTTADKAKFVEFTANYQINDLPVYSITGDTMSFRFSLDGTLIKFSLTPLSQYKDLGKDYFLKSFSDIQKINTDKFKVLEIDGGRSLDLADFDDNRIKQVNITQIELGYIDISNQLYSSPYFILKGNSMLNTGPASVILVTQALQKNEY